MHSENFHFTSCVPNPISTAILSAIKAQPDKKEYHYHHGEHPAIFNLCDSS